MEDEVGNSGTGAFFASAVETDLDDCARRVLEALRALLERLRPSAVDPSGTLTRPELGGADFLIGHRQFPGFALAVGAGRQGETGADHAHVFFVHYGDLTRGDDVDLALGRPHWQFTRDKTESFDAWLERVMSCVETLLQATIHVRATFRGDDSQPPAKLEIMAPEPGTVHSTKAAWTWRSRRACLRRPFARKLVRTSSTSFNDSAATCSVPQSRDH